MDISNKKRKIAQSDLRLLMLEKRRKLTETKRTIDSPLAKYLDDGTLTCIICNSIVKNENIWHVHINSKQHNQNISRRKQAREKSAALNLPSENSVKKQPIIEQPNPPVKLKGILKNKQDVSTVVVPELSRNQLLPETSDSVNVSNNDDSNNQMEVDTETYSQSNELPEGFFDDPVQDAKARNVEYKDPQDEEWEKFKREIQEESISSQLILDEDHEFSAINKEIELIDEPMHHWSRMQILEEKVEGVHKKACERKNLVNPSAMQSADDDADSSYGSEEEFDEYIDWRSKRSFK